MMIRSFKKNRKYVLCAAAVVFILPLFVFFIIVMAGKPAGMGVRGEAISGERTGSPADDADAVTGAGEIFHTVSFCDENGDVIAQYTVRHGESLEEIPEFHAEGYVFVGWDYPLYSGLYVTGVPVCEDLVIEPELLDERLIALNALDVEGRDALPEDCENINAAVDHIASEVRRR